MMPEPRALIILLAISIWVVLGHSQHLNHITHIPNYDLEYGDMLIDKGNILFKGDITDTTGYRGYYLGRLDSAGQLACFKQYVDSSRVKQLIFSPSIKVDEHRYATMGFAWRKSRPMLVVFNDDCDTLFTREYLVRPHDSLYFQIMHDLVPIPGTGYAIIGYVMAYETMGSLRTQIFIMLLNNDFEEIWQNQFGGSHGDYAICGEYLSPDTLILFGIESIGTHSIPITPWSRYLRVMKISLADGSLIWEKKDIPPDRSTTFDVVRTPDNGYILCAAELVDSFYSNGFPGNYYPRNSVFNLNSDFDICWEVNYGQKSVTGGRYSDIVKSIEGDGVIAIGTTRNYNDTLGYMTVVSKISWSGDSLWTRYFMPIHENPGINYFSSSSVFDQILATENGYMLQTDVILDTLATEYPYKEQIWFLELDRYGCHIPGCHLSTSQQEETSNALDSISIQLFPNPATELLTVQLKGSVPNHTTLSIYNSSGIRLIQIPVLHPDVQLLIPAQNLVNGIYTVVVSHQGVLISTNSFVKI
jgi:hypothetical protein